MARAEDTLNNSGRNAPTPKLLSQARVSQGLAEQYAAELAANGWTARDTAALAALITSVDDGHSGLWSKRSETSRCVGRERAAKQKALKFIRKLKLVWPMAVEDSAGKAKVSAGSLQKGAVGRRSAKVSDYLTGISRVVARLDGELAPYFGGKKASKELVAARDALSGATTQNDVARASRRLNTFEFNVLKGRLLEKLRKLWRIACVAFDEAPEIRNKFRLRQLEVKRRRRKSGAPPADGTATVTPVG